MRITALTTTGIVAAAATALISAPAQAGQPAGGYSGEVIARNGVAARYTPSKYGARIDTYQRGRVLNMTCKVPGTRVDGNKWWYLVFDGLGDLWVSARYVRNIGAAPPRCGPTTRTFPASAKRALNQRQGPHVRDVRVDRFASGANFEVRCYVGDEGSRWLLTTTGRWVRGLYVTYPGDLDFCAIY